jgi:hypothetical protein
MAGAPGTPSAVGVESFQVWEATRACPGSRQETGRAAADAETAQGGAARLVRGTKALHVRGEICKLHR